jgi:hypothetical protein
MSQVITTKKINIDQLGNETLIDLNIISEPTGETIINSSVDQDVLESFVNAHNADDNWVNPNLIEKVEPTIDEKLASVGLSIDDLKAALGL